MSLRAGHATLYDTGPASDLLRGFWLRQRGVAPKAILLRQEAERGTVARADGAEVAGVQGNHQVCAEALGERDDGRIGPAEREVRVLLDEVGDARPIGWSRRLDVKLAKAPEERGLGSRSETTSEKERHLRDNEGRYDQVQVDTLQNAHRSPMEGLRSVRGGDQRSRVNDGQQGRSLPR